MNVKKSSSYLSEKWHEWIEFLHFARKHRISIKPEDWWKGVLLLIGGWGLLALDSVLFKSPIDSLEYKINFIIQFAIGSVLTLIIIFTAYSIGLTKFGLIKFISINKENSICNKNTIGVETRKNLMISRTIIGAVGYIGFQLARVAIGSIDNGLIYGADSLMYVLMATILLKEKFSKQEWAGVLVMVLGLCIVLYYDLSDKDRNLAIAGSILGTGSSLSLAILLILSSTIVQHDSPIKVVFYQCFFGLIISAVLLAFSIGTLSISDILNFNYAAAVIEGILYCLAVLMFLYAFYYVNPIVIAISSYSLDLYGALFEYFIFGEVISNSTAISSILIVLGSAMIVRMEYKKSKLKID
jgi:drug/metabolite transporter (DMT)-like permease